jgi:malectin (di-glucose binding ER protein)
MDGPEQVQRAELEILLASEIFSKSPNLVRLLRYMCRKSWEGKTEDLKEYNLAVEALGRGPDFDPSANPIVRVEVHRLREKLKKYYEADGPSHRLTITLPIGSYIPRFILREENASGAAGSNHAAKGDRLGGALTPANTSGTNNKCEPPTLQDPGHLEPLPIAGSKHWLGWLRVLVIAASALALLAIVALPRLRQARTTHASPAALRPMKMVTAGAVAGEGPVRIIAGYFKDTYIASCGNVFSGDRYFSGGNAGGPQRRYIARTRDPTVFAYGRSGNFSYDVPLKQGTYELWLYFAETEVGPGTAADEGGEGTRTFDVELNGEPLLPSFDLYADARGNFIADVRVFKDVAPASDGYLHLKFNRGFGEPFLNALVISRITAGKLNPFRLVAQNNTVTDRSGHVWEPDRYFRGGRLVVRRNPVEGTVEPNLYAGERWGAFD